ncbi:Zona pellucida-like domain [Pristimantis euphronides]
MQNNRAAQCGYTTTKDVYGNVEIRISFLGCWVKNTNDKQFDVKVQFRVNQDGLITVYPVSMSCTPVEPWDVREIVCEENYMEVSVTRIMPPTLLSILYLTLPVQGIPQRWQVWFNNSNAPIYAKEAIDKGYGVNATVTRVVFRAPYNTSESKVVEVGSFHLDVVVSSMWYSQTLLRIIVDTTVACPNDPPVFTATALSWMSPVVLSPLVSGYVTDNEFDMGINGRLLNSTTIQEYTYIFQNDLNAVEVTIPYGAPGGYIESDIVNNTYVTMYSIHLLLKRQWLGINEDDSTTHTSYKLIVAPLIIHTPVFVDHTLKVKRYFNVSLGNFYPDVDLKSFIIRGVPLTLDKLTPRQMTVATAMNPNHTKVFYLTVPFSDPVVEQTYLGGPKRSYKIYVTYILTLVHKNKDFTYSDVVECIIEDVVPPVITSYCTNDQLVVNMKRGNLDYYWIPYIWNLPLNNALISSQGITVRNSDVSLNIMVPYTSVGLIYEVVKLSGSLVSLNFTLRNNQTLEILVSHTLRCNFPTRSLLCLANGTIIAVVDSTVTKPAFDAQTAHLRDPTCTPQEATTDKALFNFAAYACGTTRWFDSDYLVYENEVTFDRRVLFPEQPIISRDSSYRLTVRCRYPIRDTLWLSGHYKSGPVQSGFTDTRSRVLRRRTRAHVAELKLAKDKTFTAFYQNGDFPVSVQPADVLYFQADVQSSEPVAALKNCWATTFPGQDGIMRWDLIVDGCDASTETFSSEVETSPDFSPRFKVTLHEAPTSQLFIHCKVIVCDTTTQPESCPQTCNQTEHLMGKRSAPVATEVVSAGPVQVMARHGGVDYQYIAKETSWAPWTWVLSVGLGIISAFTVGAVFLAVRNVRH